MPLTLLEEKEKRFTERLRGWALSFLDFNRPEPTEWEVLSICLDEKGFGVSRQRLASELSFLVGTQLIRVFPAGSGKELTDIEQQQLLQRCSRDETVAASTLIWIRTEGINLVEGRERVSGVQRVRIK